MQVRVRWPAQAAKTAGKDLRPTVAFRDESLPLPLRIHLLNVRDSDTGEEEFRNVGFEIGEELRDEAVALDTPELTAVTLRRVVERYPHWLALARAHAAVDLAAPKDDLERQAKRAKPARLDGDWYRMIASEYQHHVDEGDPAPITTIARSHGVTPSAASRWVTEARERELITEPLGHSGRGKAASRNRDVVQRAARR